MPQAAPIPNITMIASNNFTSSELYVKDYTMPLKAKKVNDKIPAVTNAMEVS
jgi:hypothetical protein